MTKQSRKRHKSPESTQSQDVVINSGNDDQQNDFVVKISIFDYDQSVLKYRFKMDFFVLLIAWSICDVITS